jgi:hypothetical protein
VRSALVAFVLLWLLGPSELRAYVPIWVPFLIALGVELAYFAGAWRGTAPVARDRGPQPLDLERYGFPERADDEGEDGEEEAEREPLPPFYVPPPPSPLRRLAVGVVVIAVVAAGAWWFSRSAWERLDEPARAAATERFSAEASRIVGREVEIRCDDAGAHVGAVQDADGVAIVGGRLAYLTPEICHDLYALAFDGEITFSRTARAIAVLAHEAWHLRGERDEGVTECYAYQSGVDLGRRLGLREETARRMMQSQLAENALRGRGDVEYLVPGDCRDGGALDLDPSSSDFP